MCLDPDKVLLEMRRKQMLIGDTLMAMMRDAVAAGACEMTQLQVYVMAEAFYEPQNLMEVAVDLYKTEHGLRDPEEWLVWRRNLDRAARGVQHRDEN